MMKNEPTYKHYTRGGQIAFHNLRMWDQITKTLFNICFLVFILSVAVITISGCSYETLVQAFYYHLSSLMEVSGHPHIYQIPYHNAKISLPTKVISTHPLFIKSSETVVFFFLKSLMKALSVTVLVGLGLCYYFIKKGREQSENKFVRGGKIEDSNKLKNHIIKNKQASDITLDGFPLIKNSEVQHMLVHGTVGKGKTQLIMKIMDTLKKRGDRVIIYDKGATFIESFYDESKDIILNPFDTRCASWDLWAEAPEDTLLENMAESLIPMHGENDPFWVNAARTVFSSAAAKMRNDKDRSLDKLLKLLVTGEFQDLEPYLEGTAGGSLVSNKIEKTAISIRSVITTYLKSLQSLSGLNQDKTFSIRDYILNQDTNGWLFISSNGEQHKSLKPLISMWIAMASLTLLSLPEDSNRRIWFICDELPSLHKLPLLGETIAEIRKFGGCFVLGMQSFSQLVKVYGQNGAAEIFDLLNTRAFFASPSADMAQLVSKELGDEDIEDNRENYSYGANSIRDGISLGKNRVTRPLVTPPEIMSLDALECYLRLPGLYPITKLKLTLQKRAKKHPGFIKRTLPKEVVSLLTAPKDTSPNDNSSFNLMPKKSPEIEFLI